MMLSCEESTEICLSSSGKSNGTRRDCFCMCGGDVCCGCISEGHMLRVSVSINWLTARQKNSRPSYHCLLIFYGGF